MYAHDKHKNDNIIMGIVRSEKQMNNTDESLVIVQALAPSTKHWTFKRFIARMA